MDKKILGIILIAIILRVILVFSVNNNFSLMNPDEELGYQVAANHHAGLGYTYYNHNKQAYSATAFNSPSVIFIYEFMIKHGISKEVWVILIYLFSGIVYALSVLFFYKLCIILSIQKNLAFWGTAAYAFFPSVSVYIGSLFAYENIAMPLLIINIYLILSLYNRKNLAISLALPLSITLSCIFRLHSLPIYALLTGAIILLSIKRRNARPAVVMGISLVLTVISLLPTMSKNKQIFGVYMISTQTGFELLQGFNPSARGSWQGGWNNPASDFYKFTQEQIPNIAILNEYEENIARKKVALNWIKEHPLHATEVVIRKILIYFLPQNFEVLKTSQVFNPLNGLIYCLFIAGLVYQTIKKGFSHYDLIILSPFIGSMFLTIIFFTGYRWRFYAEPFMILYALYALQPWFMRLRLRNKTA